MTQRRNLLTAVVCSLLLSPALASGGRAEPDWPVPRGAAREVEPYRFRPGDVDAVPKEFREDHSACLVYYGTQYRLEADGTVETTVHEVTHLSGRKGVQDLGEYTSITFDPSYQRLTLNEARVVKPDGSVVPVGPEHVRLRDVGTDYQTYNLEKELVISFPGLATGDTYEVQWTVRGKSPEFAGHFFTRYRFGSLTYPVLREEVRLLLPAAKSLKHAWLNGRLEFAERPAGDGRLYSWRAAQLPPLPKDADLPPAEEMRLELMASTFPSWDAVGRWKKELRADCWECTDRVREVVRQVTAGLETPAEKAKALTYWVRKQIRYVSIMSGTSRYTPQAPDELLRNRFGDCKDQAQLLAVMLREVGLEPEHASLGMRGDGQVIEEVPSPWSTHAILVVPVGGQEHWIDTTTTDAAWDFLPNVDRDRVAYVAGRDGEVRLRRTPALGFRDNRYTQTTHVKVSPSGDSVCQRALDYRGHAALVQREQWVDTPPGERRRRLAGLLRESDGRARLTRLAVDEPALRDLDAPVRAVVEYTVPGQFAGTSPEAGFTDGHVWDRLLAYNPAHDRESPLDLWAPFESRHRYIIELPPAYRLQAEPWERMVRSKWGFFHAELRHDPRAPQWVIVEFHTLLTHPRVVRADIEEFRRFREQVFSCWRVWVSLAPVDDPAAAPDLEAYLQAHPDDPVSTGILARLYYKHGPAGDARRVLARARGLSPRDKELWDMSAAVAADAGQREAIYRGMTKQFPDEAAYRLGLGAALIDADKFSKAVEVLTPLAATENGDFRGRALFQLGRCALRRGDAKSASEKLQSARAADPALLDDGSAVELMVAAHRQAGRTGEAVATLEQSMARPQRTGSAPPEELITLLLDEGRAAEALAWLRKYTVTADRPDTMVRAALFHWRLGRWADAFDLASRSRELDFHADAQKILGLVYFKGGDYDKAVFHLDRANREPEVAAKLILGHLLLGDVPKASACAAAAESIEKTSPELAEAVAAAGAVSRRQQALLSSVGSGAPTGAGLSPACGSLACAEWAYDQGKPARLVEQLLKAALAEGLEIGPAYGLRGTLSLRTGRLRQAWADGEKAVRLAPKEYRGHHVVGRVRFERLDPGALDDLRRAAELSGSRDAEVLHWLSLALEDAGQPAEALAAQREAVQLRPDTTEFRERLRRLEGPAP